MPAAKKSLPPSSQSPQPTKLVKKRPVKSPLPAAIKPSTISPAEVRRQRKALGKSLGEVAPDPEEIAALGRRVKDQLEDVTIEWIDEVSAIYVDACLDVRAMQRKHGRVLSTCQHGALMPYPAKGIAARLAAIDEQLPVGEIEELLDAYDPDWEIVLLMLRAGKRGHEYEVFRLPRLTLEKPRAARLKRAA